MTRAIAVDVSTLFGAAVIAAVLIALLRPLLQRYALARPNARSSHRVPTPQGGGIAVIGATVAAVAVVAIAAPGALGDPMRLAIVFAATIGLAAVGAIDDIHPLHTLPRLLLQAAAVAIVVAALPAGLRIVPMLPWWLERGFMVLGGIWLVNLVNFMDGIDWMTAAEVVPVTGALALLGITGAVPGDGVVVAIALCGAMIGFAPFNRPVARVFLGDVGSLPIGLLLVWLLALLASRHFAAALLLPLYYVADATVTLFRRLLAGERVTEAHRSHFYQRALDGGFGIRRILSYVFTLNVALAALAVVTVFTASVPQHLAALAAGCVLVSLVLYRFARATRR